MSKRIWGACLALTMGWVSASGPRSEAKPPDLPVTPDVECVDGRVPSGAVTEHGNATGAPSSEVAGSGVIADLSWLEALLAQGESAATEATPPQSASDSDREQQIDRYRQAQRIYGLGIEYQQTGNLMKARTCFQEAHLLSPETRYGRLAIERLDYLEKNLSTATGGVEEADEPPSGRQARPSKEQRFQEMMRETAPLGTVPLKSF